MPDHHPPLARSANGLDRLDTASGMMSSSRLPGPLANLAYKWRPAPAIRLSVLLHAAALIAWPTQVVPWSWLLGIIVGNHLLLFAAVFWPRGTLLGANLVRLPECAVRCGEVTLTFDDGPDAEITPRVLDVLDRYDAKASFFASGRGPPPIRNYCGRSCDVATVSRTTVIAIQAPLPSTAFSGYGARCRRPRTRLPVLPASIPRFSALQ